MNDFTSFMARCVAPGPITDTDDDGNLLAVDVRRLSELGWRLPFVDLRENDYLAELEITPLPTENVRGLLDDARTQLDRWLRGKRRK